MQVNNVGYNNYGYSSHKMQRNNSQPSFGTVGGSLRAELAKNGGVDIWPIDTSLKLQESLTQLEALPIVAEFTQKLGMFLRVDNKVCPLRRGTYHYMELIRDAVSSGTTYKAMREIVDDLPNRKETLRKTTEAMEINARMLVDELVQGQHNKDSLALKQTNTGKLTTDMINAKNDLQKAIATEKDLVENFFDKELLSPEEVAELERLSKEWDASKLPQQVTSEAVAG